MRGPIGFMVSGSCLAPSWRFGIAADVAEAAEKEGDTESTENNIL
jgi:hypothetical protein